MQPRPSMKVVVLLERRKTPSRWEEWGFRLADVLVDDGRFGSMPSVLRDDGRTTLFAHPGLSVTLFRDEAEGYYLNLTSGAPVWFVMWRVDDDDPSRAWPEIVTLSYNEAGRLLDAQERVDNVTLPTEIRAWLRAFERDNYKPELKQRRRPTSFLAPGQR